MSLLVGDVVRRAAHRCPGRVAVSLGEQRTLLIERVLAERDAGADGQQEVS